MALSRTDAHALHDLLEAVRESDAPSVQQGWQRVLECESPYTREYAGRHSEVVGLLTSTIEQINALPNESQRDRLLRYVPAWWHAIVVPEQQWRAQFNVSQIIAQADLDQLASTGDIIADRMGKSLSVPSGGTEMMVELRASCGEWLEYLAGDINGLTDSIRQSLIKDFEHVVWLIDNAELFGMARAAEAGQRAVGGVVVASAHVRGEEETARWKQRLNGIIGVLVTFATLVTATETAIDTGTDMTQTIMGVVASDDVPLAPRELGQSPPAGSA